MKFDFAALGSHRVRFIAPAFIAATVMLGGIGAAQAWQDDGTVRIGLLESQTGTYAPYGLPALWASQIAIDEINAKGGMTIDGKQVKIEVVPTENGYDAGGDPAQTLSLVKKLVFDDQVLFIKGLSVSNAGQAVFNYLNELDKQGTPIVVHSSSVGAPGLGKISKWGFRNTFSENYVIPNIVETLKKQGVKTVGLYIMKDNIYFPSIADQAIIPELKKAGIEVVAVTDGVSKDTDYSRQVNELKAANPDVVYLLANTLPAINFMKEARRRGLKPKYFLGGISQLTADTLKSGGSAMEGMLVASSYDPAGDGIKAFATEYNNKHGQDISLFAVNGHEAMYLFKDAVEKADIKNTKESLQEDRAKLRDALEKATTVSISGEKIAFNADHDTPKSGVMLVIKDGKFVKWDPAANN